MKIKRFSLLESKEDISAILKTTEYHEIDKKHDGYAEVKKHIEINKRKAYKTEGSCNLYKMGSIRLCYDTANGKIYMKNSDMDKLKAKLNEAKGFRGRYEQMLIAINKMSKDEMQSLIQGLNKDHRKSFDSLVNLGDAENVALASVLAETPKDKTAYLQAYTGLIL